MKEFLSEAEEI